MNKRYTVRFRLIDDIKDFVNICNRYSEDINVYRGRYIIDGKSIMGIFALDLSLPVEIEIVSSDAEVCNTFEDEIMKFSE